MKLYTHMSANNILLSRFPFIRELAMEAYLIENENVLALSDDDFGQVELLDHELAVRAGRPKKNTDGRIDLLALYGSDTLGIIELKNATLTMENLDQLKDYFTVRRQVYDNQKEFSADVHYDQVKWIGILVGTDIDDDLRNGIMAGSVKVDDNTPVAAIVINRFRSDMGQVYVMADSYFRNTSRNMDYTKYEFDGNVLGKGKLALAIVKKYIEQNPKVSFAQLEKDFPKNIQGNHGVVATLVDAQAMYNSYGYKRHFISTDQVILVDGIKVAVCNQWGVGNIDRLIKKASDLGYQIRKI